MRRFASSRIALGLGIAVLAGLVGTTVLAMATLGTTTTFRDAVGDMVRSDGYALPDADYVNGDDCVASTRDSKSGATFLRTASHTVTGCGDAFWQPGVEPVRQITLDFSNPVSGTGPGDCPIGEDLNACGPNLIDDVRIHTADAFSTRALSNGTRVEIYLSFHPEQNNTEFYVEYEQPLTVDVTGPTTRTITAGANAIAELYRATKVKNRYVLTSIGRYYMPMQMEIGPS